MHKIGGAHLQRVNNHYTRNENLQELQVTQTRHPKSVANGLSGPSTRPAFRKPCLIS